MKFEDKVEFFARAVSALGDGMDLYFTAPLHSRDCACTCFRSGPLEVEEYPSGPGCAPRNMEFPWGMECS